MHNYEGPVRIVCPNHHEYFNEIGGGGKAGKLQSSSVAAAITAANTAAMLIGGGGRAGGAVQQHGCQPPMFEVNNTLQSSPAESTLTAPPLFEDLLVPSLPPLFPGGFSTIPSIPPPLDHDDSIAATILEIDDEVVGDGDSVNDGDEEQLHLVALARRLVEDDECQVVLSVADAERILLMSTNNHDDDNEMIDDDVGEPTATIADSDCSLIGAPDNWTPPCPPPTFNGYQPKHDAPAEEDIDNPGGWSMYTFTPNYNSKNQYTFHSSPTGARVVPKSEADGSRRCVNGWEFHYQNWKADEVVNNTYARVGAQFGDLKPLSRKGCLDVKVLKKHGLTAEWVRNDPMFFYQMLFPICDPLGSGIDEDHRMPYFSNVAVWTNTFACWKGAGSGYGHVFHPVSIPELVHWTGVPIRNGALDGRPATLNHRWNEGDPRYDPVLTESIKKQRWIQIKRYFKLSMGIEERKKGEVGYDPCIKYDYIYRCLTHNMNYVTERADLDCTIDETTWGFSGYSGEAGGRLMNKPVSKGENDASLFIPDEEHQF